MRTSIRSVAEVLTRRFVYPRRLPHETGHSRMWVTPASGLRYLLPSIAKVDPGLLQMARQWVHSGTTVWDVGANVGLFSVAAAARAGTRGQVIAFEPDAWLASLLQRTAAGLSADHAPVTVIPLAVAVSSGTRLFQVTNRSRATSHLEGYGYGSTETGGTRREHKVLAVSLDDAIQWFPPPEILKIDVEGAELEVLQGARQLMNQHRPTIICEVAEEHADDVTRLLLPLGYDFHDGENDPSGRDQLARAPYVTLAVHNESPRNGNH